MLLEAYEGKVNMTILGTVIGIILTLVLSFFIGPFAGLLMIAVMFGLVFSTHQKNKLIYEDLQMIKEKLGIEDTDNIVPSNEEIEKELEEELMKRTEEVEDKHKSF